MKLFENSWKDGYDYYERYFDADTKKSHSAKIDGYFEWYEQKSNGAYEYLLDNSIKLSKVQSSNPREGRGKYGFLGPLYKNIRDNYWNKSAYNFNPRIFYLDIETRVTKGKFPVPNLAEEEISLIQIFDNYTNTVIMLGTREWKHRDLFTYDYEVKYINCENEVKLLQNYFKIFKELNPSFIYAWNGMGFDYPYMYNRIKLLGLDVNQLSNYGKVNFRQNYNKEEDKFEYDFSAVGHYYIDMMLVYKKFILKPRESYSLENIATVELKEHKVNHSEYVTFDDFYLGNYTIPDNPTEEQRNSAIYKAAIAGDFDLMREIGHSTFCYYGYKDPVLIKRLDDKLNLTSLMNSIADKMGCLVSDTLGTVKSWSQFLLNVAYIDGKIMPPSQDFDDPNVVGGYVKDPVVGLHEWGISEDVNSMYPLLGMVGFNMSPETFIARHKLSPELREIIQKFFNNQDEEERLNITEEQWEYISSILVRDNVALGINGAVFDKTKIGIIPTLVQEIYNSRKQAKKTMFKYEQRKILIKDILNHYNTETPIDLTKDVLDYTEDELKTLSLELLKKLSIDAENGELLWNTKQMTEKVLMNALYGALSNKYFVLFNEQIAAAITGNGRYFIRKKAISIENTLQNLKNSSKPYMLYSDTDSCVGSTIIETNNGKIKIEDLYTTLSGQIEVRSDLNFIKHVKTNIKAASVNTNKELEYNNIKYVMKHKVKKRMYKIKCNGDEVIITEDHSMIVLRNETLLEIKPKDILKTDKIIKISSVSL